MFIPAPYKRYNGGKAGNGTYQQIINFIPSIQIYIEPFVGNGGILRNLLLPPSVMICDLDDEVSRKWRKVLDSIKAPRIYLHTGNGNELIRNHSQNDKSTFIYCDPPYRFGTRRGGNKPLYRHEWTDSMHETFLHEVLNCKCAVMISHPKDVMYSHALKEWYVHDFQSMTSVGLMWDRIWMNYPPPGDPAGLPLPGNRLQGSGNNQTKSKKVEEQIAGLTASATGSNFIRPGKRSSRDCSIAFNAVAGSQRRQRR
jgi:hypothetical protein